jgi:outer membrane lipoprotein-sorting protein
MKHTICGLLMSSVFVLGCQKESSQGGPGAQMDDIQKESTNVFTLKVPKLVAKIKQGQEEKVAVSINRGKTFDQTVKLTFDLPKGVEVTPGDAELKPGQTQREFSFKAMKGADVGQHAVKVTGTPESGPPTSVSFTLQITKVDVSK